MGFFDKVKRALNIGGVSIKLSVPDSFSQTDQAISGTVTLTTKSTQTVKSVKARLCSQEYQHNERGMRMTPGSGVNTQSEPPRELTTVIIVTEPFMMQPGETKTFNVSIPLHPEQAVSAVGGIVSAIGNVLDKLDNTNTEYFAEVIADVDGAAIDPSSRQSLNTNGLHLSIGE